MTESFLTKYRPDSFAKVLGQEKVVKSIQAAIKKGAGHAFLFTGGSGMGKTTLARLTAAALGCEPQNLTEIDAASKTGVEDMREITGGFMFRPLVGGVKAVLVDECHMLSKNAWASILKTVEEPPDWGYWLLCTTEPLKVPAAIKTRCLAYGLKPVAEDALILLLEDVIKQEKLDIPESVVDICAMEAGGAPRQALANLGVCLDAADAKEAAALLRSAAESTQAIDLARALGAGQGWKALQELLKGLEDVNPESVRHIVRSYFTTVALKATAEEKVGRAIEILSAFDTPFNSADGLSPLVLAVGRVTLNS